mmetsp:Transcript_85292/g.241680  ORF Transcript_85292/g.241680 Transcript_85292/m.241680 type:complete len:102 (+) Transcript_85292:106-411(+)
MGPRSGHFAISDCVGDCVVKHPLARGCQPASAGRTLPPFGFQSQLLLGFLGQLPGIRLPAVTVQHHLRPQQAAFFSACAVVFVWHAPSMPVKDNSMLAAVL